MGSTSLVPQARRTLACIPAEERSLRHAEFAYQAKRTIDQVVRVVRFLFTVLLIIAYAIGWVIDQAIRVVRFLFAVLLIIAYAVGWVIDQAVRIVRFFVALMSIIADAAGWVIDQAVRIVRFAVAIPSVIACELKRALVVLSRITLGLGLYIMFGGLVHLALTLPAAPVSEAMLFEPGGSWSHARLATGAEPESRTKAPGFDELAGHPYMPMMRHNTARLTHPQPAEPSLQIPADSHGASTPV